MKSSCCIVGTTAILAVNQPFYDIDDCKEVRGGGGLMLGTLEAVVFLDISLGDCRRADTIEQPAGHHSGHLARRRPPATAQASDSPYPPPISLHCCVYCPRSLPSFSPSASPFCPQGGAVCWCALARLSISITPSPPPTHPLPPSV